jgi:excinuclease ABC subunit C
MMARLPYCAAMTNTEFDSKTFLSNLTRQPGVYQMYDGAGKILYVGKAKNLKNRLSSYFRQSGLGVKTQALVSKIVDVQVTVTQSEVEALLLEQNLIKSQRPPYNILLRDDKSYPYIFLSAHEDFPRITLHRGTKRRKGEYFGPFPSVGAVRDSLNFLQKTFRVRQCEDSVFRNRSRPCLQYQISRCTGPCVGHIKPGEYEQDVRHTRMFLQGKDKEITSELADQMETAAVSQHYEKAAMLRDQITALRSVQNTQVVEVGTENSDVIALARKGDSICIHILYIRQGRILGSKSYFHQAKLSQSDSECLTEFVPQFYLASKQREIPDAIILSHQTPVKDLLEKALSAKRQKSVKLQAAVRSRRQKWLLLALRAARENLNVHTASLDSLLKRFEALQDALHFDEMPKRIECFDISHSSGESTVASCVVYDLNGPIKSDYRRFNIQGINAGDDYGAMEQAIMRRYTRLQEGEGVLPDVLLIDGGKGQLNKARAVMVELGVNNVRLVGVAKGTTRKAGFETLFVDDLGTAKQLSADSLALHLIQVIRDEAHRFAITGHKQRRDKKRKVSVLEDIAGIGSKRRRQLLRHFGGLQEIQNASVEELSQVVGISKKIAEEIYGSLHG